MEEFPVEFPKNLHADSKELLISFVEAIAEKMHEAEKKYGVTNNWIEPGWGDKCRQDMLGHILKGDPRDVAIYCAFLWYHKEPTISDVIMTAHQDLPPPPPVEEESKETKH